MLTGAGGGAAAPAPSTAGAEVVPDETVIRQLGGDIDSEGRWDIQNVHLSADGVRLAVGASAFGGSMGMDEMGRVRVFDWDGASWVQAGEDILGESAGVALGSPVSLSADGNRMAVGASQEVVGGSGYVRVFDWDGAAWRQAGGDIVGEPGLYGFGGMQLSADGTRLAIGAPFSDGNGDDSGSVRVFDWDGASWVQVGSDIDGEAAGDLSGRDVSMSADGTRVAIGAPGNDGLGPDGWNSGHVRVFDWDGRTWVQVGADFDGEVGGTGPQNVYAPALSANGNRVAIGYDHGVRVYDWDDTAWVQVGAEFGEVGPRSVGSESLSADGTRVAIGAPWTGGYSGRVRVFDWDGGAWAQVGADVDGDAAGDRFGWHISLSRDGNRVAASATGGDENGGTSGYVRIYALVSADSNLGGSPVTTTVSSTTAPAPGGALPATGTTSEITLIGATLLAAGLAMATTARRRAS